MEKQLVTLFLLCLTFSSCFKTPSYEEPYYNNNNNNDDDNDNNSGNSEVISSDFAPDLSALDGKTISIYSSGSGSGSTPIKLTYKSGEWTFAPCFSNFEAGQVEAMALTLGYENGSGIRFLPYEFHYTKNQTTDCEVTYNKLSSDCVTLKWTMRKHIYAADLTTYAQYNVATLTYNGQATLQFTSKNEGISNYSHNNNTRKADIDSNYRERCYSQFSSIGNSSGNSSNNSGFSIF